MEQLLNNGLVTYSDLIEGGFFEEASTLMLRDNAHQRNQSALQSQAVKRVYDISTQDTTFNVKYKTEPCECHCSPTSEVNTIQMELKDQIKRSLNMQHEEDPVVIENGNTYTPLWLFNY